MDSDSRRRQIEHQFRETARKEVEGGTMGAKVWRRALQEAEGDEKLARQHYVKLRVQNLRAEFRKLAKEAVKLDQEQQVRQKEADAYEAEQRREKVRQRRTAKKRQGESDLSYIAIMAVFIAAVIAVIRVLTDSG